MSSTTRWAIGLAGGLVLAAAAVLVLTGARVIVGDEAGMALWYVSFVATPVLTAASFPAKDALLRRATSDWTLYDVVRRYKLSLLAAMVLCFVAGLVPCGVAAYYGQFSYPLLIAAVPLAAFPAHFPRSDRLHRLLDDIIHEPA